MSISFENTHRSESASQNTFFTMEQRKQLGGDEDDLQALGPGSALGTVGTDLRTYC